jgi:hypothetical protein
MSNSDENHSPIMVGFLHGETEVQVMKLRLLAQGNITSMRQSPDLNPVLPDFKDQVFFWRRE